VKTLGRLTFGVLLLGLTAASGICEVHLPKAFLNHGENVFLSQLVVFLETVSDFSGSDLEIESYGELPVISLEESIDFYLIDGDGGSFQVLYRGKGAPSYRKAAVSVKQLEKKQNEVSDERESSGADTAQNFFIEKGQQITISITSGVIKLVLEGKAIESGGGSELVRVRVVETGKEFFGTVAGPSEVRVDL
jgi:hypothetical protein